MSLIQCAVSIRNKNEINLPVEHDGMIAWHDGVMLNFVIKN